MKLDLYQYESCRYCDKVRRHIDKLGIKHLINYHDTLKDPEAKKRLLTINDDDEQVPCLVIDGKPMLESDDIIKWLTENIGAAHAPARKI